MKNFYSLIIVLCLLLFLQPFPGNCSEKGHHHGSMKEESSKAKILSEKEIKLFLSLFTPIEKELATHNSSMFKEPEHFGKHLKESKKIFKILKKAGISFEDFTKLFNSIMDAYNEVKMIKFENRIKENKHGKFIPREKLMIDHKAKEHEKLHVLQKKNFKNKFPEKFLGGSILEPEKNLKLIEKHEKQFDKLFMN